VSLPAEGSGTGGGNPDAAAPDRGHLWGSPSRRALCFGVSALSAVGMTGRLVETWRSTGGFAVAPFSVALPEDARNVVGCCRSQWLSHEFFAVYNNVWCRPNFFL